MLGDLEDGKGLAVFQEGKLVMFVLHFLIFFGLIFLVDNEWLSEQTMQEAKSFGVVVGDDAAIDIFDRSTSWYQMLVVENELDASLRTMIMPKDTDEVSEEGFRLASEALWVKVDDWLNNLWTLVFQAMYRINVLGYWLIFTLPVILLAIYDGFSARAIKRADFGWTSVNVFRMGAYLVFLSPVFVTLYLMLPIMPAIAHCIPVLFVVFVAIGARLMASHFMRYW